MSIEENSRKSNPQEHIGESAEDQNFLEGDFDIVPTGTHPISWQKYLFGFVLVLLIASASFGLGKLSRVLETRKPVVIRQNQVNSVTEGQSGSVSEVQPKTVEVKNNTLSASAVSATKPAPGAESVVASKNGKKYHFPWCSGAKRISDANKIIFANSDEARKAGYTPAVNCKGLK